MYGGMVLMNNYLSRQGRIVENITSELKNVVAIIKNIRSTFIDIITNATVQTTLNLMQNIVTKHNNEVAIIYIA